LVQHHLAEETSMDSMTMGLIGIVIASLVNLFIQSSAISTIVSYMKKNRDREIMRGKERSMV
jgi:hypothetical protein